MARVFGVIPQWADGIGIGLRQYREKLDLGRGVTDANYPVEYTDRRTRVQYILSTPVHQNRILVCFTAVAGDRRVSMSLGS